MEGPIEPMEQGELWENAVCFVQTIFFAFLENVCDLLWWYGCSSGDGDLFDGSYLQALLLKTEQSSGDYPLIVAGKKNKPNDSFEDFFHWER
jgi:hypothetical protein